MRLRLSPTIVTVDRGRFLLTLWKMKGGRDVRAHRFEVGIGSVGHATPAGMYFIQSKSRNPAWRAPDSDWVDQSLRGKTFLYDDPRNPFAGGFVSLGGTDGIGIHGTKFDPKVGARVSHGCIRMRTDEFLKLYDKFLIGSPVFIY